MTSIPPLVSVLMPVYNGMPYLPLAVESILKQTFTNFEFIIVNDCSTDGSLQYVKSLTDKRIILIDLSENGGVTPALQQGMKTVKGKYMARLDSDDIAMPHRLERQVKYLEARYDVGLLGTGFITIDAVGKRNHQIEVFKDDTEIRWKLLFKNPFFHSTIMLRMEVLRLHNLNYELKHGEDYHLWLKMMEHCQANIIEDALIEYRSHQQSWTFTKNTEQGEAALLIATNAIEDILKRKEPRTTDLINWVRGRTVDRPSEMTDLFIELVKKTTLRYQAKANFVLDKIIILRKRNGFSILWNKKMLSLYRLMIKSF